VEFYFSSSRLKAGDPLCRQNAHLTDRKNDLLFKLFGNRNIWELNKMGNLGRKEKAMMTHLEAIIHRYVFTQQHPGMDVCRKPEVKIVEILGARGSMIMTELAEASMLSLSTVTGLIDGLVEKEIVKRERSEKDRRIVKVELTSEGEKIYEQALEVRLHMVRGMLGALNREEQEQIVNLFKKIGAKIDKEKKVTLG
jgi:DNA-binding MarR family transcriptional regulator